MALFGLVTLIVIVVIVASLVSRARAKRKATDSFNESKYAQATGNTYSQVALDDGLTGEFLLGKQLELFDPSCPTFFNLYIPKQGGGTSEIDALLVHPTGVYVFESKNYSGWIFGNEADKNWTQTLNKNSKYRFPNPIRQNEGHVRALQAYLGLRREVFYSVVVFGGRCELKKITATRVPVVKTFGLSTFLQNVSSQRPLVLSFDDQRTIVRKLAPCAHVSEDTKWRHIAQLGGDLTNVQIGMQQAVPAASEIKQESSYQNSDGDYWKGTQPIDRYFR